METIKIKIPLNTTKPLTEELAIIQMMVALERLIEAGALVGNIDDILVDYDINLGADKYVNVELKKESFIDGTDLLVVGAEKIFSNYQVVDGHDLEEELERRGISPSEVFGEDGEIKTFSMASITEKLKLQKMNPRVQMRYLVMDYKRFYNSKKNKLMNDPDEFKRVRDLFINDLMGLFNRILPEITNGKQLNSLLGVAQVSPKLTSISRELSINYKKALLAEKNQGMVPKSLYQKLTTSYKKFVDELLISVFPGIENIGGPTDGEVTNQQVNKSVNYSYASDGRIKLFS